MQNQKGNGVNGHLHRSGVSDFMSDRAALPGEIFRDEEVYREEVDRIFSREWIGLGCAQSVPKPGDVFPVTIAGFSLLMLRDATNSIRVFYNMCAHRGAPLVSEPCHVSGGMLACPYHAWIYGFDGQLRSAPYFDRSQNSSETGPDNPQTPSLIPVRSEIWRDVVFIDLSGEAPSFAEKIAPLDDRWKPWPGHEIRPLSVNEFEARANWKLAAENFLDAYHLPIVHSQICPDFSGARKQGGVVLSDSLAGMIMPSGYGEDLPSEPQRFPRFSGVNYELRSRIEVFVVFPNTLMLVEPDYQQTIILRPQGPDRTQESFASYLVSDAAFADQFADLRESMDQESLHVNQQDVELLENLQKSRSMTVSRHTRMAPNWDQTVDAFQKMWGRRYLAPN